MWRRLQRVGSVAVKNAVYVLPRTDPCLEDFQWVANEIVAGGGEATVCEATFIEGITNSEVVELFRAARAEDYGELILELNSLKDEIRAMSGDAGGRGSPATARVSRLRSRFAEIRNIDFFSAKQGDQANVLLSDLESKLRKPPSRKAEIRTNPYRKRVWVTRKGIHVDRIASAWLIRRFIDPQARFKFVAPKGYVPEQGELRFDMFDAEFTHEGDRCTFEVLIDRISLRDRAVTPIAEAIHDIDLKESKFGRPETPGLAQIVAAICTAHKEDAARLERGAAVLDDLYEFHKKH